MNDMTSIVRIVTKITFLLLAGYVLSGVLLFDYRSYMAGFILGTIAGLIHTYSLSYKVKCITEQVARQEIKRYHFGFVTRICIALLTVMVALKYKQHISVSTTIISFFIHLLLPFFITVIKSKKQNA